MCRELAANLGLHLFTVARQPAPVTRLATTRRHVASKRRRSPEVADYLHSVGNRLRLYRLQGGLAFASVERIVRELMNRAETTDCFILDLKVVQSLDAAAARLLAATRERLGERGKSLLFADAEAWWQMLVDAGLPRDAFFADDDFALEHGEDLLLAKGFAQASARTDGDFAHCALLAGLAPDERTLLEALLTRRHYRAGQTIVAAGQMSDDLFIITRGAAMVSIPTQETLTRLDVFTPGMAFGELAFLDRSPRSANVTALEDVECLVLAREDFDRLDERAPALKIGLLENMARGLTRLLRQADRELAALR